MRQVTVGESKARRRELDELAWNIHQYIGEGKRGDQMRKMLQAGVVAGQNSYTDTIQEIANDGGVSTEVDAERLSTVSAMVDLLQAAHQPASDSSDDDEDDDEEHHHHYDLDDAHGHSDSTMTVPAEPTATSASDG